MESLTLTAKGLRFRRLNDEAVASRTLTGDPAAFLELHRRYRKRVEAVCASRLDGGYSAEDAAQETFIRVLRAAPQQIENVEAWLLTIARNVCIDFMRRPSRVESPMDSDVLAFQETLPAADTATELIRRDTARQVFLALRRLPTRYRTALTLREFHGMSSAEIAESMNVSLGTVDSLVSRARDSFGVAYAEASGFPDVCRTNIERLYRELGTGLDAGEKAQFDAHVADCPRCRAEYQRAHSPRYVRGLVPLLVAKMPTLNIFADAISRSAEAPGVMHSLPALTATAVATISAAVVLSPVAVRQVMESRAVEAAKAGQAASASQTPAAQGASTSAAGEVAPVVQAASAEAASAEAPLASEPTTVLPVAPGAGTTAGSDSATPADSQVAVVAEAPVAREERTPAAKPSESKAPADTSKADEPAVSAEPAPIEPAAQEPPTVAGEDGWGELPEGAVFQELESVPTGE